MSFHIYLPIAGDSINLFLLLGLGGTVGFLSGLFGVGGGFLLTPLLIMIGIPPTVAAASDSNQIVAASTSGTIAHTRSGTVDFKMGILLLVGGVAGGTLGVRLIKLLRGAGEADFVIAISYVVMLGSIGAYMFYDSVQGLRGKRSEENGGGSEKRPSVYARLVGVLPFKMEFKRSGITLSALMPLLMGMLVGVLSAIMGVGGGFIMVPVMIYLLRMPMHVVVGTSLFQILFTCLNVPVMIYLLRMPMHVVVGTSLFQILFTCLNVTVMQSWMNHTVDFMLALMLLIGSVVGAQVGARVSTKLKADQLKILMSVIVLAVMIKMAVGLLARPDITISYIGGH